MLLILMLFAGIIAYVLQNLIFHLVYQKGFGARIKFHTNYVDYEEEGYLTEVIENRKWFPLPVLHVSFRTKTGLEFENTENMVVSDTTVRREVFSLLWNQRVTRKLNFRGSVRGHYFIQSAEINVYNLLMTKDYYIELPQNTDLYVYPKQVNTEKLNLLISSVYGTIQTRQRYQEDMLSFAGIREYRAGDEMKRINWKASAKGEDLLVNLYDSMASLKCCIILDVSDKGIWKELELAEEGISLTSSLAGRILKQGGDVAVYSNAAMALDAFRNQVQIPMGRDAYKLHSINESLAEVDVNRETVELTELIEQLNVNEQANCYVLISKNESQGYGTKILEKLRGEKIAGNVLHIVLKKCSITGAEYEPVQEAGVEKLLWEV